MNSKKKEKAFFALLCAGLWEQEARLEPYGEIDFPAILDMAEEQSVVGLIAAGIEHVADARPAKKDVLRFIGRTVQLEQRNQAMNYFIGVLVEKMREAGIYTLLVKGQGVAQCYERPLWRSCGDVDFFLSDENYEKAKEFLKPLASSVEEEHVREKHLGLSIDPWVVELHGNLYSGLSSRVEKELDDVYLDTFYRGNVRSWMNGLTQIFLLKAENDAFYVFTHILQHFYKEGVGLRQICDWCRLLYTNRDSLNYGLLEQRIKRAGLVSEWKALYNLASRYLGMPDFGSGLTVHDSRFDKKADRIMGLVLKSGNFGHNKDLSYRSRFSGLTYKIVAVWRRFLDFCRFAAIFPLDAPLFFVTYVMGKVK